MLREKTAGNISVDELTKLEEITDGLKNCLAKVQTPSQQSRAGEAGA